MITGQRPNRPWDGAGYRPPVLTPAPRKVTTPAQVVSRVHAEASDRGDLQVRAHLAGYADSVLEDRVRGYTGTTVVERCTVTAESTAITGLSLRVIDTLVQGRSDGITPTASTAERPTLIQGCELVGPGERVGSRHHDGIQIWAGGHTTIRGCFIRGWDTSAIMVKADEGPVDQVLIEDCHLVSMGGPAVYVRRGHTKTHPTNVTIRRCVLDGGGISVDTSWNQRTPTVQTEAERAEPWWVVIENCTNADGSPWAPPRGWHRP